MMHLHGKINTEDLIAYMVAQFLGGVGALCFFKKV